MASCHRHHPGEILSQTNSYRRKNALTGDWVLVSPQRGNRPWSGEAAAADSEERLAFDPNCPLCPGTERANNTFNADYRGPHVFNNDFSALTGPELNQLHIDSHPAQTKRPQDERTRRPMKYCQWLAASPKTKQNN